MKVQVKKQSIMEGTTLVKELYFLLLDEDYKINIGKKTYDKIEELIKKGVTPETNEEMNETLITELKKETA